ncbi:hypothetical protein I7I48_03876 [Histoplasma ohiense]|nr:hypothetical protein I7I48_03876 [Histoplasma ohiense (nom. inval.)]
MPQRMSYRGLSYGVFQFVESLCPKYTFLDSSHQLPAEESERYTIDSNPCQILQSGKFLS